MGDNILNETKQRAAILHAQGTPIKKICEQLEISQPTLWAWKQDPLFIKHEQAYKKLAWDTAMHSLTELGGVASELLLRYLRKADEEDESARKLCIDTMKLLLAMGKTSAADEPKGNSELKEAMKTIKDHYKDEDKVSVIKDS